jgi:hypothetical protein
MGGLDIAKRRGPSVVCVGVLNRPRIADTALLRVRRLPSLGARRALVRTPDIQHGPLASVTGLPAAAGTHSGYSHVAYTRTSSGHPA